jgi:outer membrane receptor protein involved in Fe transport
LDGDTHNDPYNGLNQPLPFPDALQEFKVETSSVPAQYGQHSAGAVNAVTKSGTNEFHGGLFEFVRNKIFNARNAFAPERDGLKRNQFGGVLGRPFVLGDTYLVGPGMVSSFRGTLLRTISQKDLPDLITWTDLGVKNLYYPANYAKLALLNVNNAFTLFNGPPRASPGSTNSTTVQLAEDMSWAHGKHQIGFGVNHIHAMTNYLSGTTAAGEFAFNSQNTGLALGDFLLGRPSQFQQQTLVGWYPRESYLGMYVQDTWKASSHLTVIPGLRWVHQISPDRCFQ